MSILYLSFTLFSYSFCVGIFDFNVHSTRIYTPWMAQQVTSCNIARRPKYEMKAYCTFRIRYDSCHDTTNNSLQWRHNELDGVWNHKPHDCLLNRLFGCRLRKPQSSASMAFARGIHRSPVNSPHKWPLTQKMFPFNDVIMCYCLSQEAVLLFEISQGNCA